MDCNWITPKAEARPTGSHGMGSFAIAPIGAGELVCAFAGGMVNRAQLDALPEDQRARSMQVHADLYVVSTETPEAGDFVNHSCDPNCGLQDSILLVAMRDIAVGEELTFDYAMCDVSDYSEFDCSCGSPLCRGRVSADDWRRPELIERYRGYQSTYVRQRIAELEAPVGAVRR